MNTPTTKRLAIALTIAVILVFGSESTMALLRRWNIDVEVQVTDAMGVVVTAEATADASPTPGPTPVAPPLTTLAADQRLNIDVVWNYRIGPRFPSTQIEAMVLRESDNSIAASGTYNIDCGTAALSCTGNTVLSLTPTGGTWIPGTYYLTVNRAYAGLNPSTLKTQEFQVASSAVATP